MNELGLAAQGQQRLNVDMVEQVKQMLAAGVSEQELLQRGIPADVIQAAVAQLSQEISVQQAQAIPGNGLAASQGLIQN